METQTLTELKRAEIKDGKICLEGKVYEPELLKLELIPRDIIHEETEEEFIRRISTTAPKAPKQVNAYYLIEEPLLMPDTCLYPILYLKIKGNKK